MALRKITTHLLAIVAVWSIVTAQHAAYAAARSVPNVVLILADDLGYGDPGCYNKESKIPTPNLDRLAKEGTRFVDAHAPDAVCTPTRYGIMTGRYCFRSRMKHGVLGPYAPSLIEPGRLTLPAMLREHGYTTGCIGKWHLGWDWPMTDGKHDFAQPITNGPTARGFDSYFGVDLPNYPPYCFIENDHTVGIPSLPAPLSKGGFNRAGLMVPGWKLVDILPGLTRQAVRFVEEKAKSDKPFFLYLPLTSPHYPVVPAPEFKGKSRAGDYGDFVNQTDWTVGQVLNALERTGAAANTLVIFTSDNGPEVTGEVNPGVYDRARQYGHYSMDGLRGAKRDVWEGGHRVPYLARWPGHVPAAAVSEETICHVDLMATAAALVGAKLPDNAAEDSYNILPALLGQKLEKPLREATLLHSCGGKLAIRQGQWMLIDAPTGDDNREPEWFKKERGYQPHQQPGELYNLKQDLIERKNLYGDMPEKVRQLKDLLEKYKADGRSTPGTPQPNTAPEPATKKPRAKGKRAAAVMSE